MTIQYSKNRKNSGARSRYEIFRHKNRRSSFVLSENKEAPFLSPFYKSECAELDIEGTAMAVVAGYADE